MIVGKLIFLKYLFELVRFVSEFVCGLKIVTTDWKVFSKFPRVLIEETWFYWILAIHICLVLKGSKNQILEGIHDTVLVVHVDMVDAEEAKPVQPALLFYGNYSLKGNARKLVC